MWNFFEEVTLKNKAGKVTMIKVKYPTWKKLLVGHHTRWKAKIRNKDSNLISGKLWTVGLKRNWGLW